MAKDKKKDEKAEEVAAPAAVTATPPVESTALATAPGDANASKDAAPTAEEAALANIANLAKSELAAKMPSATLKMEVLQLARPSNEELADAVTKLSPAYMEKFAMLLKRATKKKQGAHAGRGGFQPVEIRVFQGMGKNPNRPKDCLPNEFFTDDSRRLGETFKGIVFHTAEGQTLWPPKGAGKGGDDQKRPICSALGKPEDGAVGTRYGPCIKCPLRTKPVQEGGCGRETVVHLVDENISNIYKLRFTKTSAKNGSYLANVLRKGDEIWGRFVTFGTETGENKEAGTEWRIIYGKLGDDTPAELTPVMNALSRLVDADVYYPGIAYSADRYAAGQNGDTVEGQAEEFNEREFVKGDTTVPDYSADV